MLGFVGAVVATHTIGCVGVGDMCGAHKAVRVGFRVARESMNRFADGRNEGISLNAEYEREWGMALYYRFATMYIPAIAYKAIAVLCCLR
jgi:hypothetical protein